ncbi:hypothetical protein AAE478_008753 [Parahypoxylon ruwenzoriense]
MEFANHSFQEKFVEAGKRSADVIASRLPRKMSLTSNFSYPRPDRQLIRHGASDSRSSLASNDSMPGMTDSSDSETSFDDDCNYNTSASELWDSFWPDSAQAPGEQYPILLRASREDNYFTKAFSKRDPREAEDATLTISQLAPDSKITTGSPPKLPVSQRSPPRPATRSGSSTYSVYPKPQPIDLLRVQLPPRTSSLNAAPLSPPQRQALKPSKSSANLKSSKLPHRLPHLHATSSASKLPLPPTTANSVPASPAYPPPPRPLRSATSAFNLRDNKSPLRQVQHNATAPLPPPPPTPAVTTVEPQPSSRPQLERYVSVFEFDSDRESYSESNSFTKRIARGFHKKSASEKRSSAGRRSSEEKDEEKNQSRKRGGSLGRILGLRSR